MVSSQCFTRIGKEQASLYLIELVVLLFMQEVGYLDCLLPLVEGDDLVEASSWLQQMVALFS